MFLIVFFLLHVQLVNNAFVLSRHSVARQVKCNSSCVFVMMSDITRYHLHVCFRVFTVLHCVIDFYECLLVHVVVVVIV